jgi:sugar lactone lactonase YvrE
LDAPAEFEIIPAIEGLKRVRFFAKAPDGRIFVTDMYNLTDNKHGTIYILDDWNERTGKFARAVTYMTGLHNPNSVQFYRDGQGVDWIYIAETGKLTRRIFRMGEGKAVRPAAANAGDVSRLRPELQVRRLAPDADHRVCTKRKIVCFGRFELQFVR